MTVTRCAGIVLAVLALAAMTAPVAVAAPDRETSVYTLSPSDNGNPEGVAWDPATQTFFTGTTANGTIYRGTLDDPTVEVWIPGAIGRAAIGMKVDRGLLYVAGGGTGRITVYDIATASVVAAFETGAGGFLNDLVVTPNGIFVTDSLRPVLWRVTAEQVAAGAGTPEAISVSPEIPYGGGFALNGIVGFGDGSELIVVHSALGTLYKITFSGSDRTITQVASPTVNGDGLLLDRGRLVVVLGDTHQLAFLKLNDDRTRAALLETRTDPTFQRPSTVARARNLYLVVNADFTTNTPPFTLSGLPRKG